VSILRCHACDRPLTSQHVATVSQDTCATCLADAGVHHRGYYVSTGLNGTWAVNWPMTLGPFRDMAEAYQAIDRELDA